MSKNKKFKSELKNLSLSELEKSVNLNKKELFNLRVQKQVGDLKNTARFKLVRRMIAQAKFEISSRNR